MQESISTASLLKNVFESAFLSLLFSLPFCLFPYLEILDQTFFLNQCMNWKSRKRSFPRQVETLLDVQRNQNLLWPSCALFSSAASKISWRVKWHCFYERQIKTNAIRIVQIVQERCFIKLSTEPETGLCIQKKAKRGEWKSNETMAIHFSSSTLCQFPLCLSLSLQKCLVSRVQWILKEGEEKATETEMRTKCCSSFHMVPRHFLLPATAHLLSYRLPVCLITVWHR